MHTLRGTRRFSVRDLPAGTITMLFTDIEGSTHLLQQLGDRYAELLTGCRNLLRAAFHTYRGQEVDTQGDAIFAAFARASDALLAAVAAQRELANHCWPGAVAGGCHHAVGPRGSARPGGGEDGLEAALCPGLF